MAAKKAKTKGFNIEGFKTVDFKDRTEAVLVPDMAVFFDGPAEWVVRGLTASEIAISNEAAAINKDKGAIVEMLCSNDTVEKIEGIKEGMGISDSVPEDIVKRFEHLKLASVNPECDHDMAMKLAANYPVEFYQITNKITNLTGQGRVPGKLKASTTPQA